MPEIVQFFPAIPTAGLKRDSPTSVMTGAIANGEINAKISPIIPVIPTTNSINDAEIIAPLIGFPDELYQNFSPKLK